MYINIDLTVFKRTKDISTAHYNVLKAWFYLKLVISLILWLTTGKTCRSIINPVYHISADVNYYSYLQYLIGSAAENSAEEKNNQINQLHMLSHVYKEALRGRNHRPTS